MSTISIASDVAQKLYFEHEGGNTEEYEFEDKEFYGEWRSGTEYELVIKDVKSGKYYSTVAKEQSGDNWYLSLEDSDSVKFQEVQKIAVTSYEYKRVA